MEGSQKFCRVSRSSAVFKPNAYRLVNYLDLSSEVYFHSFRKTGIQTFWNVVAANPSNFRRLSYLDLEGCYYVKSITWRDVKSCMFQQKIDELVDDVIFRGHIFTSYYRVRKQAYGMEYFYSHYVMAQAFVCPLLEAFLHGRDYKMHALLELGVHMISVPRLTSLYRLLSSHPLYHINFVYENIKLYFLTIRQPEPSWEAHAIYRLCLTIDMAYILCRSQLSSRDNWRNCYRLLWRSIPDPFLSIKEIWFGMTYLAVEDSPYMSIRRMCFSYVKSFPDMSPFLVEPRPLKHLSRCAIRHCMREKYSLPYGIETLKISQKLKFYLQLDF